MKKYRLAVDVDEVLADTHAALAAWYRDTHGYCWSPEQLARTPLPSLVSAEHARGLDEMLHEGEIFRHLDVMPGSQLALERLMGRFEIFIVTAAMEYPASCAAKHAWLQEHFPFIHPLNIVFCGDKSIVSADLLVDDCARHFTHFGGQGVLFDASHNRTVNWPIRVEGWTQALSFLEAWGRPSSNDPAGDDWRPI